MIGADDQGRTTLVEVVRLQPVPQVSEHPVAAMGGIYITVVTAVVGDKDVAVTGPVLQNRGDRGFQSCFAAPGRVELARPRPGE